MIIVAKLFWFCLELLLDGILWELLWNLNLEAPKVFKDLIRLMNKHEQLHQVDSLPLLIYLVYQRNKICCLHILSEAINF